MSWQVKLEEIREKPEHIRMRYVWGMVFISMFLVFFIWAVSLDQRLAENPNQKKSETKNNVSDIKNEFNNFKEEASSVLKQQPSLNEELKKIESDQQ